jgi:HSP20 family protein
MIKETDKTYEVVFEALGLGKDDISIEVENNDLLIITAENYIYGNYKRMLWLSDDIDKDNITANCNNGLLTITLPKKEREIRKIEIK